MYRRRAGERRADRSAGSPEKLRGDMFGWRRFLSLSQAKPIRHSVDGCVARHTRVVDLKERALTLAPESVCSVYTDASGKGGRGTNSGDMFVQGSWPPLAEKEGITWKELWAPGEALRWRGEHVPGELFFARTGNGADYGAGRPIVGVIQSLMPCPV